MELSCTMTHGVALAELAGRRLMERIQHAVSMGAIRVFHAIDDVGALQSIEALGHLAQGCVTTLADLTLTGDPDVIDRCSWSADDGPERTEAQTRYVSHAMQGDQLHVLLAIDHKKGGEAVKRYYLVAVLNPDVTWVDTTGQPIDDSMRELRVVQDTAFSTESPLPRLEDVLGLLAA